MKKFFFRIFYIIFFVVFVSMGLELCLRVFDPIGIEYVFAAKKYFRIMERNKIYGYKHKAGTNIELQGVAVRINNEGFRGEDFQVEKPKDVYRVLIYGDSVVFGWGVAEEDALAPVVQKMLPPKILDGRKIEVLSVGVGSWNSRTQYEYYNYRAKEYGADIIVWLIVNNDIEPKLGAKSFVPTSELKKYKDSFILKTGLWSPAILKQRRKLAAQSYLAASLERFVVVGNRSKMYDEIYRPNTVYAQDAGDAVVNFVRLAKSLNTPLVVFLHGEQQTSYGKLYHTLYRSFFEEFELEPRTFPKEIYLLENKNSFIDPHQNKYGLKIMSKNIVDVLQEQIPIEKSS